MDTVNTIDRENAKLIKKLVTWTFLYRNKLFVIEGNRDFNILYTCKVGIIDLEPLSSFKASIEAAKDYIDKQLREG